MKSLKNIITVFAIVIAIVLSGCKKSLELVPFNAFSDETAYSTPERCLLALNGVYDAAQSGDYDPLNGTAHSVRGYPFGAAALEQNEMRGEDMVNIATFFQITYQATYTPVSPNNVNMWINLYLLINKANLAIDGFKFALSKGIISTTVAAQYEAECRFLRAMAHHELLINFSRPYLDGNGNKLGVPYHDYAISSPASLDKLKAHARELVSVCYDKILIDLDFAETNLPAGANVVRAAKAAAIALKMRVKMHKGDWSIATGVVFEGNKLIPNGPINPLVWTSVISPIGGNKLEQNPNGAFLNNSTLESIFSIKNDALDNTGVNAALAQMFGPNVPGRGLVAISPVIFNSPAWRCDDKRRDTSTVPGSVPLAPTPTNMIIYGNSNANTKSFFTRKYIDYVNQADYTPILRYAEVLLMQAEAEARNSGVISQRAIELLNTVRNRAIPAPALNQYTIVSFADKNALIKAILDERRIEFLAEGKRWGDIHRLAMDPNFSTGGIPAKVVNGFSNNTGLYGCSLPIPPLNNLAIAYADYRFLWPIPQDELVQNPVIVPNPGY